MTKYKNDKIDSLKSLIPYRIENLPEAKEYVANAFKTAENCLRETGRKVKSCASFYRKHPADAVFTTGGGVVTAETGYQLGRALNDPEVLHTLIFGYVPKGTTIFPTFNNPQNYYSSIPRITPTQPLWENPSCLAGIVLPIAVPLAVLGAEYVRQRNWRKKFEKETNQKQ